MLYEIVAIAFSLVMMSGPRDDDGFLLSARGILQTNLIVGEYVYPFTKRSVPAAMLESMAQDG